MCYEHEAQLVQSTAAPADARRIVQRMCSEFHVEELTDTAALLTSELVTNAIRHAAGPVQLGVACSHGRLVVSVHDSDPHPPQVRRARGASLGGRGLALVDKLADDWGSRQVPHDGKSVWFALRPRKPPVTAHPCACPAELSQPEEPSAFIPSSRDAP